MLTILSLTLSQVWAQNFDSLLIAYDGVAPELSVQEKLDKLKAVETLARDKKNNDALANTLRRIGIVRFHSGELENASKALLEALRLQQENGNRFGVLSTFITLGNVYFKIGQSSQAIRYYEEAAEEAEALNYKVTLKNIYLNLGQFLTEESRYVEAEKYLMRGISFLDSVSDVSDIPYYNGALGFLYLQTGDYAKSRNYLERARVGFNADHNLYGYAQSTRNLAFVLKDIKKVDSAFQYMQLALDSAMIAEEPETVIEIAQDLGSWYLEVGDTLGSFHFIELANRLKDSVINEAGIERLIEAEQKYRSESKSKELKVQKETLRQRNYLILSLTIALGLGLLAFLLYRYVRLQKEKLVKAELEKKSIEIDQLLRQQELSTLQAQMQGQNEERDRIARDLHDRLGSLLSTIKLQFSHFEGRLTQIESEFKSTYGNMMTLIDTAYDEIRQISHDLSSGTLNKFGFNKAVQELVQAIQDVNPIQIHYLSNKVPIEDYTQITESLYRIIQELLSNTLKYAEASEVNIQLSLFNGTLSFTYEDDGKGFDQKVAEQKDGIGMLNIKNRVEMMQGTLNIDTSPGHGVTVMIEIPL